MHEPGEITRLLAAARDGDRGALDRLLPLVYDDLRAVAHRQLRRRRPGDTFDSTVLVHEAYLKLADRMEVDWQDRNHFLSVAAVAMRHILVDYARRKTAQMRGGGQVLVTLDERRVGGRTPAVEILALDEALERLAALDGRLARVVELRFFGGLSVEETAELVGTSERTVKRDWRKARALLLATLDPDGDSA